MTHERLFDYSFDYHEYIEKRLREIDDIEERKFASTVLKETLLHIIEQNEADYCCLEKRVADEVETQNSKYNVRMTIIKREDYNSIHPTLFPVAKEDLHFLQIEKGTKWKAIKETLPLVMAQVFMEASDEICDEIEQSESVLSGVLVTDKGEFASEFSLRKSIRYRNKIASLYETFHQNHICWSTLNTAYLDKFFDIRLIKTEGEILDEACIMGIRVNYALYQDIAHDHMIPLWNIEEIEYHSAEFPMPCIDSVNYEHEFPTQEFGISNGFLILKNKEVIDIRFEAEKIIVVTPRETFNQWEAYRILSEEPVRSLGYTYPILTNCKKKSFITDYMLHTGAKMQTKADLLRGIGALDAKEYIAFEKFEILETAEIHAENMNWFIKDELFDDQSRRILMLYFKAKSSENYLNDAMVRFVVSSIQTEFCEYRCVGCLI